MHSAHLPAPSGSAYEIRVRDHFDTYWYAYFDGWTITNLENGEVLMSHAGIDQPGLHGVLNKIRDLNLILISVTRIHTEPVQQTDPTNNQKLRK